MLSRLFVISVFATLAALGSVERSAAAATSFNVTNSGMSAYVVDGVNNPTLTLTRGQTYTFTVTSVGHPFWIATARGAGDTESNAFAPGVTGNGASSDGTTPGTLTFVVPASAPATLFYQCSFHDPMGGTLNIFSAAPVPSVPSVGAGALAALAGLLLFAALRILRRRQNASAAMRSQDQ